MRTLRRASIAALFQLLAAACSSGGNDDDGASGAGAPELRDAGTGERSGDSGEADGSGVPDAQGKDAGGGSATADGATGEAATSDGATGDSATGVDASTKPDASSKCRSWQPTGTIIPVSAGADLQSAINAAPPGSVLKLAPATYAIGSSVTMASGVSIDCSAGATLQWTGASSGGGWMITAVSTSDNAVWGCTFDHNHAQTGGVFLVGVSNFNVMFNTFINTEDSGLLQFFNSDGVYIVGNTATGPHIESFNGITNDHKSHHHNWVTDNKLAGFTRIAIEYALGTDDDIHFDRNTVDFTASSYSEGIALSIVSNEGTSAGAPVASGTMWGNTIGGSNGPWAFEIGIGGMTVSNNDVSNVKWAFVMSSSPQTAVLDNTVSSGRNEFGTDGGYLDDFWIGTNTVDGSGVNGWPGHGISTQPSLEMPSPQSCAPY